MLRETVRAFGAAELAPRAAEIDRTDEFPRDLWPRMGEPACLVITVEEDYGGAAWVTSPMWFAVEEISRARAPSGCLTARIRICA